MLMKIRNFHVLTIAAIIFTFLPPTSVFAQSLIAVEANKFESFAIFFVNSGAMLEFGDEVYCAFQGWISSSSNEMISDHAFRECRDYARSKILYIEENHTYTAITGALLGYVLLAPTAILYYYFYGRPRSASEVFTSTLKIEIVEGGICVVGQLLTDGNFDVAIISLGIGFASGLVRGSVLFVTTKWATDQQFRGSVIFWGFAAICGVIYFLSMKP